ncbi:MAG: RNA methyltransferase [Bacteroidota bacterium]|nr:RNA methyltransferase [Bacteroidota bacterium]
MIEGDKMVQDILQSNWTITELYAQNHWLEKLIASDRNKIGKIVEISFGEMKKVSSLISPHNVIAVVKIPEPDNNADPPANDLSIALDRIQDPGNLGTIIRTAAWFGIENVYCSIDSVDVYNPKVIQSTMSALLKVNVRYIDLLNLMNWYIENSLPVYGTFINGKDMFRGNLHSEGLILMGNESSGISSLLQESVTHRIAIPHYPASQNSRIESLNVASATAIVCAEFRRRT